MSKTEDSLKCEKSFLNAIRLLVGLLESFDPVLGGHLKRVSFWCVQIGNELNLREKEMIDLEVAALLHDMGKTAIPDELKKKPFSELSKTEESLVKQQSIFTQDFFAICEELKVPGNIIRYHLERVDGSGFPDGLKEEKIPLGSRTLAVANAFDELVTKRQFSGEVFTSDKEKDDFALSEIKKLVGRSFPSEIVEALRKAVERVRKGAENQKNLSVDQLSSGMVLASDIVWHGTDNLAYAKDTTLTPIHLVRLKVMDSMNFLDREICVYV